MHYRGAAPAMVALVGGDIRYMFDNLTTAIEQVRAGRVKALAVTSAERNPQLSELPACARPCPGSRTTTSEPGSACYTDPPKS